jgi:hypothetical protein
MSNRENEKKAYCPYTMNLTQNLDNVNVNDLVVSLGVMGSSDFSRWPFDAWRPENR